jgi:hypothetical protein
MSKTIIDVSKLCTFGNEDLKHITKETIISVLETDNPMFNLQQLVLENPHNHNTVVCAEMNKLALVLIKDTFEPITRDELRAQILFVRLKYIIKMINKYNLKKYKKKLNEFNVLLETLQNDYLYSRTGILDDASYFSEEILEKYENIKKNNLEKLELLIKLYIVDNNKNESSSSDSEIDVNKVRPESSESDSSDEKPKRLTKKKIIKKKNSTSSE